ncbi:hypothetical protein [Streptomyces europaeiscabiei]|uniref:hypothetical protein n=1 Tax=Streptomyces europaeiscabiei TaxID=146819 RepID=UPI0038F75488
MTDWISAWPMVDHACPRQLPEAVDARWATAEKVMNDFLDRDFLGRYIHFRSSRAKYISDGPIGPIDMEFWASEKGRSMLNEGVRKARAWEREQARRAPPLEREWQYLRTRARGLGADWDSVKSDADHRGLDMEPYARLREAVNTATELLQSTPGERLANVIRDDLNYVRYGLDRHRERMDRKLNSRSQQGERAGRERDAETRRELDVTNLPQLSGPHYPTARRSPSGVEQLQDDLRWFNHPGYRLRDESGW